MKKLDLVYFEDTIVVYIDGELDFFTTEDMEDIDWLEITRRAGVESGYVDATDIAVMVDGDENSIPSTLQELKEFLGDI